MKLWVIYMTIMRKKELFKAGYWAAKTPHVCTKLWDDYSWIHWIDANGKWLVQKDNFLIG